MPLAADTGEIDIKGKNPADIPRHQYQCPVQYPVREGFEQASISWSLFPSFDEYVIVPKG
jgi:hypothetical protein